MSDKNRPDSPERDDIETLVRLAEPHSEVPPLRRARARVATHAAWSRHVRGRQRRRFLLAGSSLVAAAATILLLVWAPRTTDGPGGAASALTWVVEEAVGGVTVSVSGGEENALAPGFVLASAAHVRTGADGRVSLRAETGHSLRIDRGGDVELLGDGDLALHAGAVYLDSGPDGGGEPRDLHTPFGVVREIGTQYEARMLDGGLRLRTREGAVVLVAGDTEHRVDVGSELHLSARGDVVRGDLATYGSDWEWISSITSVPDFAGRPVADFLGWLAREKGCRLTFGAPAVLARSRDTVLRGDLTRLTPDEALGVVAATSGLAIVENGESLEVSYGGGN